MVAAYIEHLGETLAKPSVKQHLAAIRMLCDYLVTGGILPFNPASSVRGPKYVQKRGKTPVLDDDQMQELLDSIDVSTLMGLRYPFGQARVARRRAMADDPRTERSAEWVRRGIGGQGWWGSGDEAAGRHAHRRVRRSECGHAVVLGLAAEARRKRRWPEDAATTSRREWPERSGAVR